MDLPAVVFTNTWRRSPPRSSTATSTSKSSPPGASTENPAKSSWPTSAPPIPSSPASNRSEEHTSELESPVHLVCRLLLEKKKTKHTLSAPTLLFSLTEYTHQPHKHRR